MAARCAAAGGTDTMFWPLGVYFAIVIVVVVALLGLSALLGQHHRERTTSRVWCRPGRLGSDSARASYLVAVLFVIFDLEAAFIFSWAVALRKLGWPGYVEGVVFIGVLCAALAYLWRIGGLDFAPSRSVP